MERRDERRLLLLALALGVLLLAFLYWPLLAQPFILDDIDLQWILARGRHGPVSIAFADLLRRCSIPNYFRPLAAPLYLLSFECFGLTPVPLRLLILGFILLCALQLARAAKALTGDSSIAFFAASIYFLSWIHWDTAAATSNLPQPLAHVLLWQSVILFVRPKSRWTPVDALVASAPATIALLLKEDAVILPALVAAGSWPDRALRRRLKLDLAILVPWCLAYIGYRLLEPGAFLRAPTLRLYPLRAFELDAYLRAGRLLLEGWLRLAPTVAAHEAFRRRPLWLAAALGLGCALGALARAFCLEKEAAGPPRSLLLLGGVGALAAVAPYAAFGSVYSWTCHRLDLAWAAVSLGAAPPACFLGRRLARFGRPANLVFLAVGAALVLRCAAFFWFPDYRIAPFARLFWHHHTREASLRLANALNEKGVPGAEFVFVGFDPAERMPALLETMTGRPVQAVSMPGPKDRRRPCVVTQKRVGSAVELTLDGGPWRPALRDSWPLEPRL